MDTRSRKRRRGNRTSRLNEDHDEQATDVQDATAVLPEFRTSTSYSPSTESLVTGSCSSTSLPRESPSSLPWESPSFIPRESPYSLSRECSKTSKFSHARSPSPARMFRQREQSELKLLNERLSSHSDHMKQLQAENLRLKLQVEAMDGVIKHETNNIKLLHGEEMRALQSLLDKCIEEKCQAEAESGKVKAEVVNLQQRLKDRDTELTSLKTHLQGYQTMSRSHSDLKSEVEAVKAALKNSLDDVKRLNDELGKERRTNKRLVDESTYNRDRYLKEVEEASGRFSRHIQNADERLEEGYEKFVAEELASVREQHVRDLNALREELTTTYQHKILEWKTKCETAQAELMSFKRETKTSKLGHDHLRDAVTQVKAEKASLEVQLLESRERLAELKESSERDRCQAQREVAILTQELSEVRGELDEISEANIKLESEINAYRQIVEDLELQSPPKRRLMSRRLKTQETLEDETRSTERTEDTERIHEWNRGIGIPDVDPDGKYITLVNSTDHSIDLCLWSVQETNGAGQIVKYEISSKQLLDPGQKLTLWSSDVRRHVTDGDDGDSTCDVMSGTEISDKAAGTVHVTMLGKGWLKLDKFIAVRVEDGDGQLQAKCQVNNIKDQTVPKIDPPRDYLRGRRSIYEDVTTSSSPTLSSKLHPLPVFKGSVRFPEATAKRHKDDTQDKDGCLVM